MIVLRNKQFGFMDNLKGNPELRESLKKYDRGKILPEIIDEFPELEGHDDFLKVLTCIKKNKTRMTTTTDSGVNIQVTSVSDIMDQVRGKSVGFFKKGEGRLILIFTIYGDNDYVVSYIPETKKYVITKESPKWNLLARGINYAFGDNGPQRIGEYRTFGDAFKFMNTD